VDTERCARTRDQGQQHRQRVSHVPSRPAFALCDCRARGREKGGPHKCSAPLGHVSASIFQRTRASQGTRRGSPGAGAARTCSPDGSTKRQQTHARTVRALDVHGANRGGRGAAVVAVDVSLLLLMMLMMMMMMVQYEVGCWGGVAAGSSRQVRDSAAGGCEGACGCQLEQRSVVASACARAAGSGSWACARHMLVGALRPRGPSSSHVSCNLPRQQSPHPPALVPAAASPMQGMAGVRQVAAADVGVGSGEGDVLTPAAASGASSDTKNAWGHAGGVSEPRESELARLGGLLKAGASRSHALAAAPMTRVEGCRLAWCEWQCSKVQVRTARGTLCRFHPAYRPDRHRHVMCEVRVTFSCVVWAYQCNRDTYWLHNDALLPLLTNNFTVWCAHGLQSALPAHTRPAAGQPVSSFHSKTTLTHFWCVGSGAPRVLGPVRAP
jgi:hypothetical protein